MIPLTILITVLKPMICDNWPDPAKEKLVYVNNPIEADLPGHWVPLSVIKKVIEWRVTDNIHVVTTTPNLDKFKIKFTKKTKLDIVKLKQSIAKPFEKPQAVKVSTGNEVKTTIGAPEVGVDVPQGAGDDNNDNGGGNSNGDGIDKDELQIQFTATTKQDIVKLKKTTAKPFEKPQAAKESTGSEVETTIDAPEAGADVPPENGGGNDDNVGGNSNGDGNDKDEFKVKITATTKEETDKLKKSIAGPSEKPQAIKESTGREVETTTDTSEAGVDVPSEKGGGDNDNGVGIDNDKGDGIDNGHGDSNTNNTGDGANEGGEEAISIEQDTTTTIKPETGDPFY